MISCSNNFSCYWNNQLLKHSDWPNHTLKIVNSAGVFDPGLPDHCLVFAVVKFKKDKAPPKIITTRNYKLVDTKVLQQNMENALWSVMNIFNDIDDAEFAFWHTVSYSVSKAYSASSMSLFFFIDVSTFSIFLIFTTSSNHRLESAGLNALEELLFTMLGIEKMVMRALFWKHYRNWRYFRRRWAGHGGMFICTKLRQNLSEMEDRTL